MVDLENEIRTVVSERGYVVMASETAYPIGHVFNQAAAAREMHKLSQPFAVVGIATEQEFEEQLKIINRLRGSDYHANDGIHTPFSYFYKAVTD